MYQDHIIIDKELKIYQKNPTTLDNNIRARLLYEDQRRNFSWLRQNLKKLEKSKTADLDIDGIEVRLMLNTTRQSSIKADTFQNNQQKQKCKLCDLPRDQRGFTILDDKYFIIP